MSRRAIAIVATSSLLSAALLSTSAAGDAKAAVSPSPFAAMVSSRLAPSSSPRLTWNPDLGGGGLRPSARSGVLTASATTRGYNRSEAYWNDASGARIRLPRYATVTTEFDLRHHTRSPAGAAENRDTWRVVYQIIGPSYANTWPGPPLAIDLENGTYRVGGGAAAPTRAGGHTYRGSWYLPYAPAPDDVWRHFTVQVYLDGPGAGWVSIWIDGTPYISRWKPAAGTFYTDAGSYSTKDISVKTGLYTSGSSATWKRTVEHRNVMMTWSVRGLTKRGVYAG